MTKNIFFSSKEFVLWLQTVLGTIIVNVTCKHNEICVTVSKDSLVSVLSFLKKHSNCQYEVLTDITAVDYPTKEQRFEIVYQLLSLRYNHRIIIKVCCNSVNKVNSISNLYPAANWYEREVFDIFGIYFSGHPDLRRILTDYGFEGYPLRKDYPLSGYTEVRYDLEQKRVICEPLEFSQEFRIFNFPYLEENDYMKHQKLLLIKL